MHTDVSESRQHITMRHVDDAMLLARQLVLYHDYIMASVVLTLVSLSILSIKLGPDTQSPSPPSFSAASFTPVFAPIPPHIVRNAHRFNPHGSFVDSAH
jgi:hypothetical protein